MIALPLKPGDVVRLRSGGPWMTVESTDGAIVVCVFFNEVDANGGLLFDPLVQRVRIHEAALMHEEEK